MPESAGRWLTEEERRLAIQRTKSSGNTDRNPFDKKQFLAAVVDYKVWLAGNPFFFKKKISPFNSFFFIK